MKEFSIEEKAKRYDKAIEIAKEINNEQRAQPFNIMTKVFPELKESEDERIRNWLICTLKSLNNSPVQIDGAYEMMLPAIAWLEKQGEQKPIESSLEELDELEKEIVRLSTLNLDADKDSKEISLWKTYFLSLSHKQNLVEWSEEDESWFKELELMALSFSNDDSYRKRFFDWLKSLKERVLPQPKQEWSTNDVFVIKILNTVCDEYLKISTYKGTEFRHEIIDAKNWLKSLKERYTWKPSDEQMLALADAIETYCGKYKATLTSFYNVLKKLTE